MRGSWHRWGGRGTIAAPCAGAGRRSRDARRSQFILEDEKGDTRVRLSAINEAPALALLDEAGKKAWSRP